MHRFLILCIPIFLISMPSMALDINGQGSTVSDVTALYLFEETSGPVLDTSGVSPALNLEIENESAVDRRNNYLNVKNDTVIRSTGPAEKMINSCADMTIEMWVENNRSAKLPEQIDGDPVPLSIVGFSSPAQGAEVMNLSQFYEDNDVYRLDAQDDMINSSPGLVVIGELQHIYLVRRGRDAKLFVGSGEHVSPRLSAEFDNPLAWSSTAQLTIGHKANFDPNASLLEKFSWKGRMHMLAIYCRALTDAEIMGDRSPTPAFSAFTPDLSKEITENHKKAALIYQRLAGVKTPIDNPVIDQMATDIEGGNLLLAAGRATAENSFFNITVRDFASRLSTRDESVNTELNDFIASFIGVARDGRSAKELLTGNFYYVGDPDRTAAPSQMINDMLRTNNHYQQLDVLKYDLANVLVRRTGQRLYNGSGGDVLNPNAAGVLTSRAFLGAHAVAGTNRRLVEFTFREFLCVPIEKWSDATGPDNMIGRDIDRFPAGDHSKFQVSCRSCHSNMDGLRGAFSEFTFSSGFVKNARVMASGDGGDDDPTTMKQNPIGVAAKYNHNENTFTGGFVTTSNNFVNNANRGANASYFGWTGSLTGKGVREFGSMVANSQAFPRCFAKRAFRSVCKREPATFELSRVNTVGDEFAQNGFNLKYLFERIAIMPECIGPMGGR